MSEFVRCIFAKELAEGRAKAREEARAEAEMESCREIARNLIEQTLLDDNKIAKAVMLSLEEVQSIRRSCNL